MALKKSFASGTRFYYAVIKRIAYQKPVDGSRVDHRLTVDLFVKDSAQPDYSELQSPMGYDIPSKRFIKEEIIVNVPELTETGEYVRDSEGEPVTNEVSNGFKEVVDGAYQDPFGVKLMQPKGVNIVKVGYEWLKKNIELFKDWENC